MPSKFDKRSLSDLLRQLRGSDLPERGRIDQINMAPDDFCEGPLGALPGVACDQFQIGLAHVHKDNVAAKGNPPANILIKPARQDAVPFSIRFEPLPSARFGRLKPES
jgi:hypothetical protein